MWFIDVEVEQETSAPRPKKNPGSPPDYCFVFENTVAFSLRPINNTDKPMSDWSFLTQLHPKFKWHVLSVLIISKKCLEILLNRSTGTTQIKW